MVLTHLCEYIWGKCWLSYLWLPQTLTHLKSDIQSDIHSSKGLPALLSLTITTSPQSLSGDALLSRVANWMTSTPWIYDILKIFARRQIISLAVSKGVDWEGHVKQMEATSEVGNPGNLQGRSATCRLHTL